MDDAHRLRIPRDAALGRFAWVLWALFAVVLGVVVARMVDVDPQYQLVNHYEEGSRGWWERGDIYRPFTYNGFLYLPHAAILYTPFTEGPLEFRGGPVDVKPGQGFPTIDVEVEEVEHDNLWYRIHLVAKPAGEAPKFRRGDANGDGRFDIADPIFHLSWLFSGGADPKCLDASDADGDGAHNLTDAIFSLQHLFVGGPEPPAPGPNDCGPAPEPKFGCETYDCTTAP